MVSGIRKGKIVYVTRREIVRQVAEVMQAFIEVSCPTYEIRGHRIRYNML